MAKSFIQKWFLPFYLSYFQIAFIILLGIFGDYKINKRHVSESNREVPELYSSKILTLIKISSSFLLFAFFFVSVYGRTFNDVRRFRFLDDIFKEVRLGKCWLQLLGCRICS